MTSDRPLSYLHQLYSMGELPRKEFEGRLFQYLLDNSERYHIFNGNREQWDEFISWLYPRLIRTIDLYRNLDSSFDTYIGSVIYGASREYRCREVDHYTTECACWQARAEEMRLFENEPEYSEDRKETSIPKGIKPQQILFLLLKSYCFVTDDFVERAARSIGMKSEVIWGMIDEVRTLRSERDVKILELRERYHTQHYRCLAYHRRMSNSHPGTEYHERMKVRYERARKRYYTTGKRLKRMRMGASNKMIAGVLGIPKGTVDSSLSAVKSRLIPALNKIAK